MASFIAPLSTTTSHRQTQLGASNCPLRRAVPRRSRHPPSRGQTVVARVRRGSKPQPKIPEALHEAEAMYDIDCNLLDFSKFDGKVTMVVNVASDDEQFTDTTYKMLTALLDKYHDSGFEVIVFPSNWFGQLETRTFEEIKHFVHSTYSDKIHVMAKTNLDWNPVFALGKQFHPGEIIWNFHGKFLFGKKGLPVARYDLLTTYDYIDSQLQLFLFSPNPDIHIPEAPDRDTTEDDKDYSFSAGREGYEPEEEEDEDDDDDDDDEEKTDTVNQDVDDDDDVIERENVEEEEEVTVANNDATVAVDDDVDADVDNEIVDGQFDEDADDSEENDDEEIDDDSEESELDAELAKAPKKVKSRKLK